MDKFVWGIEVSYPNRNFRIMQKRGKIVDNDDFSPIQLSIVLTTYSEKAAKTQKNRAIGPYKSSLREMRRCSPS